MSVDTPPRAQPPHTEPMLTSARIGPAGLAFLIGLVVAWFLQVA